MVLRVAPAFVPALPQIFGEGIRRHVIEHGRPEGGGAVVVPLTFENAEMACSRALGLGTQVEVLSPSELRKRVAQRAAATAAVYGTG